MTRIAVDRKKLSIFHLIAVSQLEHAISVIYCHADNAVEAAMKIPLNHFGFWVWCVIVEVWDIGIVI